MRRLSYQPPVAAPRCSLGSIERVCFQVLTLSQQESGRPDGPLILGSFRKFTSLKARDNRPGRSQACSEDQGNSVQTRPSNAGNL